MAASRRTDQLPASVATRRRIFVGEAVLGHCRPSMTPSAASVEVELKAKQSIVDATIFSPT
uniref:Uncharacterized protein n=1 Tax=Oryza nivara TaxID=4536 RepID=A0A0E0I2J3_ORYNI